jgi:hypothetical protein
MFSIAKSAKVSAFMRSSTDHMSGVDDLTPSVQISKNGGAFNTVVRTVTGLGNGLYSIDLTSSDTDTEGELIVLVTSINADNAVLFGEVSSYSDPAAAFWAAPMTSMGDRTTAGGYLKKVVLSIPTYLGLR